MSSEQSEVIGRRKFFEMGARGLLPLVLSLGCSTLPDRGQGITRSDQPVFVAFATNLGWGNLFFQLGRRRLDTGNCVLVIPANKLTREPANDTVPFRPVPIRVTYQLGVEHALIGGALGQSVDRNFVCHWSSSDLNLRGQNLKLPHIYRFSFGGWRIDPDSIYWDNEPLVHTTVDIPRPSGSMDLFWSNQG